MKVKQYKVTISEEALEELRVCIDEKEEDGSKLIRELFTLERQADNEEGYNEADVRDSVTVVEDEIGVKREEINEVIDEIWKQSRGEELYFTEIGEASERVLHRLLNWKEIEVLVKAYYKRSDEVERRR